MAYRYALEKQDDRDYASGRVFYGLTGQPAFPVRLASEMLQRCIARQRAHGRSGPYVLYDPLCGGAYLLSTLAYLHWTDIAQIIGSDVDEQALSLARRNLGLLTAQGIDRRITEIEGLIELYGKASHRAALKSAKRLKERLLAALADHSIPVHVFQANAANAQELLGGLEETAVDIVLTDVPYGRDARWQMPTKGREPPLWQMLDALSAIVSERCVVAVAADKGQRIAHPEFRRIERFRLGKRQIALLQAVG
jgi:hypothetical protein